MPASETNACCKLAELAEELAARQDIRTAQDFIFRLGERAAGIRPGFRSFFDLFLAGRNLLPGHGFRPEFEDGSDGQARHFAGVAVSSAILGPKLTIWLSEKIRLDPPDQPDGRLTLMAVSFSQKLVRGELLPQASGHWIRENLCLDCP
jgi:hypothetical protein